MAVIYSKLGGCLGVTTKLGPLARTDLCAGVKGLLERLMTHLGLGSSLEEPWLDLWGGVEEGGPSLEGCTGLQGRLSGLKPGGKPSTLPVYPGGVGNVPCLGCLMGVIRGLGRIVFFPCGSGPGLRGLRGRAVSFRGKLYSSRGRIASFPGEEGEQLPVFGCEGETD